MLEEEIQRLAAPDAGIMNGKEQPQAK